MKTMKTTSLAPGAADAPDDIELARRVGCRDERAFELLMRRHNQMLYRIARAILRDDAEAEDAVQDAYLAAFRNIASFRGGARLSTWLARIVINEAYGRLRKQKHRVVVVAFDAVAHEQVHIQEETMADDRAEPPASAVMRVK